jgi:hypothetical protein
VRVLGRSPTGEATPSRVLRLPQPGGAVYDEPPANAGFSREVGMQALRKRHRAIGIAALLMVIVVVTVPAMGKEPLERVLGLGFPTIGRIHYDDDGALAKLTGFNLGLGYSVRYFSTDPWKPEELNFFWGWGTIALIVPYIEFGFSYPIPISDGDRFLVIDFGLLYLVPYVQFSMYY